jgi:2-methylcitrate dehydratase PrpD
LPAPDPLRELARSAARLRLEDVPAPAREHALRVLADTVGVIMGGARDPAVLALVEGDGALFSGLGGSGPCTVLAPGLPAATPVAAAFANGTAGTFLELDEGLRPTGHPSVHVLPAALAAAQALRRPGASLLVAYLAGYEVTARLFDAYRLRYPAHPHGHFGAVGAAVAVACLRQEDPAEPAAIAATLPLLPVWEPCYEGATARNAYTGLAAATGVLANRMAAAGLRGTGRALEASYGELAGELVAPEALAQPVRPDRLRITDDYLKLHSACALTHSALDAVLQLRPPAAEVESVTVETVASNLKLDRQAAPNELSTRFSLQYAVAAAIVHGHAGPDAFRYDPAVARLAERVSVRHAPDLEAGWPGAAPARVTVEARGGARRLTVQNPHGHRSDPASADELRQKFGRLSWAREPDLLYDRLLGLERVADCGALFAGLAGGST